MRKNVARIVSVAALASGFLLGGCSVSVKAGGSKDPSPPPPPPPAPAAKPPPPKPSGGSLFRPGAGRNTLRVSKGGRVDLPGPVVFETGSDKLAPESDAVLELVHIHLKQNPQVTLLRIEGHTDDVGDDDKNQDLSERRSMSVARWLVARGTDCKRLLPVGFGETKPVNPNTSEEGRARNRRTAFFHAEIKGKPVGDMPVDGGGKPAGDPCK